MKTITPTLLATAAMGAVSIGSASAMPFSNLPAALGESDIQNVRVVCDEYRRCHNTTRSYRYASSYYAPRSYNSYAYSPGDGYGPAYGYGPGYGYYGRPFVGIGIGPFSLGF
jgi:hypothetical protein